MYVMLTFLEVNDIRLDCTNDEVVEVGLAVASGAMNYETLLEWGGQTVADPLLTQNPKKSGQGWMETTENPPNERRQKAQSGAETAPICP